MSRKEIIVYLNLMGLVICIAAIPGIFKLDAGNFLFSPDRLNKINELSNAVNHVENIDVMRKMMVKAIEYERAQATYATIFSRFYLLLTICFLIIFICQIILWARAWRDEKKRVAEPPRVG